MKIHRENSNLTLERRGSLKNFQLRGDKAFQAETYQAYGEGLNAAVDKVNENFGRSSI